MNWRVVWLSFAFSTLCTAVVGQEFGGTVRDSSGVPLVGASVYWADTGVGAVTDTTGTFRLHRVHNRDRLVASYMGYLNDTITVNGRARVNFCLKNNGVDIETVVVEGSAGGNYIRRDGILKGEMISFSGLSKMACCNLAESFENSASVTVGYSDAVSGSRQIKMLGLAGIYTQILDESRPIMRGMGSAYGLNYTPGMWLSSIQVSKGITSVTSGHEAITGQINLEHRKPTDDELLFVNLYADSDLRAEMNLSSAIHFKENKSLSTVILAHASSDTRSHDRNGDGFRDLPLTSQINVANKWLWQTPDGMQIRWGVKALAEERSGGQIGYDESMRTEMISTHNIYGSHILNRGLNGYLKIARPMGRSIYDAEEGSEKRSNLALIIDADHFDIDSYFGLRGYKGAENTLWGNLMYAYYLGERSSVVFGASALLRSLVQTVDAQDYSSRTAEAGAFAEYTYSVKERFSLVAGLRGDRTSGEGRLLLTPRLHAKWNITPSTVLRGSAGTGWRRAAPFTDNMWILAVSKPVVMNIADGRDTEQAFTWGGSLTQNVGSGGTSIGIDYFHTDFLNSVIADQEFADHTAVYDSSGKACSDNYQIDLRWVPSARWDFVATFRYTDSHATLTRGADAFFVERPLTSRYKGLLNVQYSTAYRRWVVDFTAQLNGPCRLPSLDGDLSAKRYSPAYPMFYLQVSRRIKHWELYAGCENIGDYMQTNPIISAEAPFSDAFNPSVVWGPLMGRKFYFGLRLNIY